MHERETVAIGLFLRMDSDCLYFQSSFSSENRNKLKENSEIVTKTSLRVNPWRPYHFFEKQILSSPAMWKR
jgi:hypothetical protein